MKRLVILVAIVAFAGAALWQYRRVHQARMAGAADAPQRQVDDDWLDRLYSQNPREVEKATERVTALGAAAVPVIQDTLRDPQSEAERLKAALKAVGILGKTAAPAIPDIASVLEEPGLTAEAAIALSYTGADALAPLRQGLASGDPVVRRESLRSIGKLKDRAPLPADTVLPLLDARMKDGDAGVRTVAATYVGIIHEQPSTSVPVLIEGLADVDAEVRRACAAALGSFGAEAGPGAMDALKRAASDKNDDVAREAGRSIVKLQQK